MEIPHVANSSLDELAEAAVDQKPAEVEKVTADGGELFAEPSEGDSEEQPDGQDLKDTPKDVIIDMAVETQLEPDKRDDVQMARTSDEQLASLDDTFSRLRQLTRFKD